MACYQNGGTLSLHLSAARLSPPLMCGSRVSSSSSPRGALPSTLTPHEPTPHAPHHSHSSHDPSWYSSNDQLRHSPHDPPRHSPHDPPRHSPHDPPRHSPHDPPRHSPHDPPRHSPHDPPRHSSHDPPRHSPHDPPRHSPHDPPRHSPHDPPRHSHHDPHRHSHNDPTRHSHHDPPRHSPHDPSRNSPRHSPHDPPRHSHYDPPRHSPHDPPRHSPHDPPRHSPHDPPRHSHHDPPCNSPHDPPRHSPRHSPHDPPRHSPHDPPRHLFYDPLRDPPRHSPRLSPVDQPKFTLYDPPRRSSKDPPPLSPLDPSRVSPYETPSCLSPMEVAPRRSSQERHRISPIHGSHNHVHSTTNHASSASNHTPSASNHASPDAITHQAKSTTSPKLSRRETDLSLNHVKLQETYINVEALEERKTEKQLSEAWKRKRRRSVESILPEYLKSAPIMRINHPLEQSVILSFLRSVTGVLLTCLMSVPLSLALILSLPVVLFLKALVALGRLPRTRNCFAAFHSDYVAPHDAQFLLQDVDNHSVIHSVLIIDASMNLKRIKQLLATRVVEAKNGAGSLMYPRLTQMVSFMPAGPAWVHDHNFNLHNHVFSGPNIATEGALQKYVSSLLSQPLPGTRPLWEIIVLHDYGRSRDTVLVCRLHQSISDGMSLVRVLCQSLSDNQIMHIPQKPHFGGTTYGMNLLKALLVGPMMALKWLWWWRPEVNPLTVRRGSSLPPPRVAKSSGSCCGCSRKMAASSSSESGAYTVWGEEGSGGQVVVWSAGVSVSRVVRIKQVTRTCLNDVLLAALTGALRLSLQRQGVVHPPDLKVNVAVDLRSNKMPFTIPRMGTKAALVPISLPLSWDAAVPRLWEVRARVDKMKASADPVVAYGLVWWATRVLPSSWARRLLLTLHRRISLQYSSLPGPNTSLLLGGYTVKHIYNVSPPREPTPVSVTVFTYADQVHVAVAARRTLPAARAITTSILREFENQCEQMSELLANRRIPGEQRRGLVFSLGDLNSGQSITDLQIKLGQVQAELQLVTQQYEAQLKASLAKRRHLHHQVAEGDASDVDETSSTVGAENALLTNNYGTGGPGRGLRPSGSKHELATRVQNLKDEFTDLLTEIRRRKSVSDGGGVVGVAIQTEFEEEDGEVRRPRKRALSTTSTWSSSSGREVSSSCMARPLTTPTQPPAPPTPTKSPTKPVNPPRAFLVTDIT
ncbi:uncharacterized protein [Procambarus clarkii]|uniref:uncharacterized protein n=1 Tax=Procambarus clarkii TaxID=6728 RepID=UPI003742DC42